MSDKNSKQINRMVVTILRSLEKAANDGANAPPQRPKSRAGKKTIAGHFDPPVAWQLRKLALDQGTTVQKLLEEALADLFGKYHLGV
jgi:hypothetical protein